MRPSDSPVPVGDQLRSSLAGRLPRCGRLFFALRPAARAFRVRVARWRLLSGSPWRRFLPEEKPGSPRFLGRPLPACRGRTPRRMRHPLATFLCRRCRRRLQDKQNPGHPGRHSFRGRIPTAHTLAFLRIAGRVAAPVARLATGWGGSPLRRTGFAPAGRRTEFHGLIASPTPFGPAFPGRTVCPMLRPSRKPPALA